MHNHQFTGRWWLGNVSVLQHFSFRCSVLPFNKKDDSHFTASSSYYYALLCLLIEKNKANKLFNLSVYGKVDSNLRSSLIDWLLLLYFCLLIKIFGEKEYRIMTALFAISKFILPCYLENMIWLLLLVGACQILSSYHIIASYYLSTSKKHESAMIS
jgi:hypothetical protein